MRFCVLLLATFALHAQDKLPPAVQSVVDLARTAPPELFANGVLKLAEGGLIPPGEPRPALMEEVFSTAARAQEPVRLIGLPGLGPDTRAMFRSKASELGLDTLSLQNRALKLLVPEDRARARRLFESLPHPALETPTCDAALIPDASAYYEMAGAVAQAAFSEQERRDERHVQLLQSALEGARTPGELAAFAAALAPVSLKAPELELLLSALSAKMEALAPDYRSFTLSAGKLRGAVEQLAARAKDQSVSIEPLARGFRRYLTQQLSAARCDDQYGDAASAVEWFNAGFHGALPVIRDDEIQPARKSGFFKAESYFMSGDAQHISEAFERLRVVPGEGPRPDSDRATPEWRNMLSDFIRDFSAWTPSGSDIDVFHQKFVVLGGLMELAPPGPDRDRILALAMAVLRSSRAETQFPAEWLFEVRSFAQAAGPDRSKLMDVFRVSGDPGLALFASPGQQAP